MIRLQGKGGGGGGGGGGEGGGEEGEVVSRIIYEQTCYHSHMLFMTHNTLIFECSVACWSELHG